VAGRARTAGCPRPGVSRARRRRDLNPSATRSVDGRQGVANRCIGDLLREYE
jgi:hypothetical protein